MKIASIGSCNIDYSYKMDHFIRPGETSDCLQLDVSCGGKGLNQSIALAQAGLPVFHVGIIGAEGLFLKDMLENKGVNTSLLKTGEGPSGHAIIQVDKSGQNCIILNGGTNRQFTEAFIDEALSHFEKGDIVVLQNEINNLPYIMDRASEAGLRIAFNAAPYHDTIRSYPLEKADWLIVNEVEGGGLSGKSEPSEILEALHKRYPNAGILLTLGTDGCVYRAGEEETAVPAYRVQAVDTTAAGDTFIGYFIKGIAENLPIRETLRLASAASAVAVTRRGAADSVPSCAEVLAFDPSLPVL